MHAFAFGVLELFTKLAVFLGKTLGTLTPPVAAGGAIANLDAGGFEFGLTAIGLRFPTIAAFEKLGNQDAQGGAEGLTDVGHGHRVAVHGGNLQVSRTNPKEPGFTPARKPCQCQVPLSLACPPFFGLWTSKRFPVLF